MFVEAEDSDGAIVGESGAGVPDPAGAGVSDSAGATLSLTVAGHCLGVI